MAYVPPPLDRDFRQAQVSGIADRTRAGIRRGWIGAGVVAAALAVLRRMRRRS
jgi:hypothetical protein